MAHLMMTSVFPKLNSCLLLYQIPVDLTKIPRVDSDTLVMIIEQLLMLLLIIGRWMLPKVDNSTQF